MKKVFSLLLSFVLIFTFSTTAFAKIVYKYGDWNLQRVDDLYGISEYTGTDSDPVIPDDYMGEPITFVMGYAFVGNQTISSVTAGDNISRIGSNAFLSATSLTQVTLTASVTEIGNEAFTDTPLLTSINLEDTQITAVKTKTFLNSGITEITLPDTCVTIEEKAFGGCGSLTKLLIPQSVTEISDDAFVGCNNLVIYCYTDSAAHQFAEAKGIEYVLLDAPVPFKLGDVDNNDLVETIDATYLQRYLAGISYPETSVLEQGDVDGDGVITIIDATFIQRYLAGIDTPYPIGEWISE